MKKNDNTIYFPEKCFHKLLEERFEEFIFIVAIIGSDFFKSIKYYDQYFTLAMKYMGVILCFSL